MDPGNVCIQFHHRSWVEWLRLRIALWIHPTGCPSTIYVNTDLFAPGKYQNNGGGDFVRVGDPEQLPCKVNGGEQ